MTKNINCDFKVSRGPFSPVIILGLYLLSDYVSYLSLHTNYSKLHDLKQQTFIILQFVYTRDLEMACQGGSYEIRGIDWAAVIAGNLRVYVSEFFFPTAAAAYQVASPLASRHDNWLPFLRTIS